MKKLFAILIMVLCVAAFSSFDAQAKRKSTKARTTHVKKSGKCSRCHGTGKVKCTKCGGKGYYRFYITEDGIAGCNKCGGGDQCGAWEPNALSYIRRGTGRMRCPSCHGRGR